MNLQKIYTALLTADLAAAEGWYTKLLGRGPDHRDGRFPPGRTGRGPRLPAGRRERAAGLHPAAG